MDGFGWYIALHVKWKRPIIHSSGVSAIKEKNCFFWLICQVINVLSTHKKKNDQNVYNCLCFLICTNTNSFFFCTLFALMLILSFFLSLCSCFQWRSSTARLSNCCIFGIFKYLCIEYSPTEWLFEWGCSCSKCHRTQLARSGYIFNEKISWGCYWTATDSIASTLLTVFLRLIIGKNQN